MALIFFFSIAVIYYCQTDVGALHTYNDPVPREPALGEKISLFPDEKPCLEALFV